MSPRQSQDHHVGGQVGLYTYYLATAAGLRAMSPALALMTAQETQLSGAFRSAHQVITAPPPPAGIGCAAARLQIQSLHCSTSKATFCNITCPSARRHLAVLLEGTPSMSLPSAAACLFRCPTSSPGCSWTTLLSRA